MWRLKPSHEAKMQEYLDAEARSASGEGEDKRPAAPVGPSCKAPDCRRVTRPSDEGYCATHFRHYRMWGRSLTPPPG